MKRTRKQVGAYSRRKGSTFEREVSAMFTAWTGLPCRRTPMSGAYGHEWGLAGDLMFRGGTKPNVVIELKRREGWTWEHLLSGKGPVIGWWKKLVEECSKDPNDPTPVLVFKKNRGDIWIGVRWFHGTPVEFDAVPPVVVRLPNIPITLFRARDVARWRIDA